MPPTATADPEFGAAATATPRAARQQPDDGGNALPIGLGVAAAALLALGVGLVFGVRRRRERAAGASPGGRAGVTAASPAGPSSPARRERAPATSPGGRERAAASSPARRKRGPDTSPEGPEHAAAPSPSRRRRAAAASPEGHAHPAGSPPAEPPPAAPPEPKRFDWRAYPPPARPAPPPPGSPQRVATAVAERTPWTWRAWRAEIVWDSEFKVMVLEPGRNALASSNGGGPAEAPALAERLQDLQAALEAEGWTPAGRAEPWYGRRFVWQHPDPPPGQGGPR